MVEDRGGDDDDEEEDDERWRSSRVPSTSSSRVMSFVRGTRWMASLSRFTRRVVTRVLRAGAIPRHVAVIMDGNRRYAVHAGAELGLGHERGADVLMRACEWCFELGVETLSVYALSTENFKRSERELEALFDLACGRLGSLSTSGVVERHDARIHVSGDLAAVPARVRAKAMEVMQKTWDHRGPLLNVCLAYTGREDATRAVLRAREGVRSGELKPEDVDETTLQSLLHGGERPPFPTSTGMPEVDLVIRTSGETRLSDYMLVNARFAKLVFAEVLWPDFTFMDMVHAIWQYQRGYADITAARRAYDDAREREGKDESGSPVHVLATDVTIAELTLASSKTGGDAQTTKVESASSARAFLEKTRREAETAIAFTGDERAR